MSDTGVYKLDGKRLRPLPRAPFAREARLQELVEGNLDILFQLTFVRSEFDVAGLIIDTLAYDESARAFVIIEYKKGASYSVIDQGFTYLANLLNNKAEFVLALNQKTDQNLGKESIEWSQSRVYFIAPEFTKFQTQSVQFRDLPMRLFEYTRHDTDLFIFREVLHAAARGATKDLKLAPETERVLSEVTVYSLDTLVKGDWTDTRELAVELGDRILSRWPSAEVHYTKQLLYYTTPNKRRLVEVVPLRKGLKAYLGPRPSDIPRTGLEFADAAGVGKWANGNASTLIENSDQIDLLVALIQLLAGSEAERLP